jgi:capsular exopolysaccharide synthesis family protein
MEVKALNATSQMSALDIDLVGMLRRRWALLLLGLGIGLGVALIYHFSTTPIYESEIEILVGQRTSELTNSGTASNAQASGDSIHDDQLATHIRLFSSRRIIDEAIKKHELTDLDSFRAARKDGLSAIDHIIENLSVRRGGDGEAKEAMVLFASFRDPNPEHAALVLNSIYESYESYVESHARNTSDEAVKLIIKAQGIHEQELAEADHEYREFVRSVPVLLDGDRTSDIHKERLQKLESELTEVRSNLQESQSRLDMIQEFLNTKEDHEIDQVDQLALLSEKEVSRLKLFLDMTRGEAQSEAFQADQPVRQEMAKAQYNRLLDLLQTERTLSETFGPGHPVVEATRSQINVIESFISSNKPISEIESSKKLTPAEMLKTYTRLLGNDVIELQRRETVILERANQELTLAKQVEGDYLRGTALREKLQRAQSRYSEVSLRLQEINLSGSYAGFSTDVLGKPEIEKSAEWPRLPVSLIFGFVLGSVLGLSLSVAAEAFDSTFSDASDLENAVGAPVICHVPRFEENALRNKLKQDSAVTDSVPTFHDPRSSEAEIYRIARTGLMLKNRRGGCQTIMVTSPHPGDGKSTTISNLAVSFAQTGKKVLLIDSDMRRPTIAKVFGIDSTPGLADTLRGSHELEQVVQTTDVPNLSIMSHGSPTSEPAELLESVTFTNMLQQCRKEFDLILIDAPPLLAVADPSIVAPLVDSVLLTVQVRKNGRRSVERAAQILKEMSITPVGMIVNGSGAGAGVNYRYSGGYKNEEYGYARYYTEYKSHSEGQVVEKPVLASRQHSLASTSTLLTK